MITSKERKIKLKLKPYDKLTFMEKYELIWDKYNRKQKITYEEYVLMLLVNEEAWFFYNNTLYQVDHGLPNVTAMYITKYNGKQKVSEQSENYPSIIELLDKFRIEGKRIREIWDDVTY